MSAQRFVDHFMTNTDMSWTKRFKGTVDGKRVSFVGQGQQFYAQEIEEDLLEVWYEHEPHEVTRERCSTKEAIQLIEGLMNRRE